VLRNYDSTRYFQSVKITQKKASIWRSTEIFGYICNQIINEWKWN